MFRFRFLILVAMTAASLPAQSTIDLPEVVVTSPRVANQAPTGTIAMPVSALSFEPRVDVQARNLAEGQADISIRGSTFENTAFRIGTVTVLDPQTGHYLAELPVAPVMLGAPEVAAGAANAFGATNAIVGSVDFGWRPIRTQGLLAVAIGQYDLARGEIYQGWVREQPGSDARLGVDVDYAHSESDGSIAFGEHRFQRVGARVQRVAGGAQTDLYAGYQTKFFGWPNLYTPFGFNETDDLETVFFALNHRVTWTDGQYFEAGVYHRRNKDDYEFNRTVPGASNPFIHTTWMTGAAVEGRRAFDGFALRLRGEAAKDKLESTSLKYGHYNSRDFLKLSFLAEKSSQLTGGDTLEYAAGLTFDDTNRDPSAVSPIVEIVRKFHASEGLQAVRVSYAKSTQVASYTALNSDAAAGLFRGNANLQRELSQNLELGLQGRFAGWQTDAAVFWRQDDRLVDWTFRKGVTARFANPVDIATGGAEFVLSRTLGWAHLVLGYTYLGKTHDYGSATVDGSFYALNYARHRLTAAATFQLGKEWVLRWDNEARVQEDNPLRTTGGDEAVLSALALAWRPQAWRGVEFTLQVDNLWNTNFQEVPAVPAANRQVALGATYLW